MKKFLLIALICLLALEISVAALNDFYFEKVAAREAAARNLPYKNSNALKHAYAASLVYSGFRTIYFSENMAKSATIFLGKINEIAEKIFKSDRDSTLEMMKDLQNNLIGIEATKWRESKGDEVERIKFIGDLAERKILILSRDDMALPENEKEAARYSSNYFTAAKWFEENRSGIESDVKQRLN